MAKLFSTRIVPLDEWILIRVPNIAGPRGTVPVLVAEANAENGKYDVKTTQAAKQKCLGIVVAVGPGGRNSSGARDPIDPNITPGSEVHFLAVEGNRPLRPAAMQAEMEAEGLWFVIESAIVCVLKPEGVTAKRPVLA